MDTTCATPTPHERPASLLGWRLLALLYDLWPVLALWMLTAVPFVLADAALSGNSRHNIEPFSVMWWLLWLTCWAASGLYATASWRRGGQTLGMRPWRLQVQAVDGTTPRLGALWCRYAVATLSVLAAGLGLWWALWDRERLTWHDRASGTRLRRLPKT